MAIKVYVSGICGSEKVRKQQQRVLFILQSMPVDLQIIDITEPGREGDRSFMQEELKKHGKNDLLPPQIFNECEYCGDYNDFQLANDDDILMNFLKLEDLSATETIENDLQTEEPAITQNGIDHNEEKIDDHKENEDEEMKDEVDESREEEETGETIVNSYDEHALVQNDINESSEIKEDSEPIENTEMENTGVEPKDNQQSAAKQSESSEEEEESSEESE